MKAVKEVEAIRGRWLYRADGCMKKTTHEDYGTKTSGNWGHKGRPGERGGSQAGGGHTWLHENRTTFKTKSGEEYSTRWLRGSKDKVILRDSAQRKKFLSDYEKESGVDLKKVGKLYSRMKDNVDGFAKSAKAKASGIYDAKPPYGGRQIKRGFGVAVDQGGLDAESYGKMCAVARRELSPGTKNTYNAKGPVIENYGKPNVSFIADDMDDAIKFAITQNQKSIIDYKSGKEVMNPFYKEK